MVRTEPPLRDREMWLPSDETDPVPDGPSEATSSPFARNLAASFPLIFLGGGCLAIGAILWLEKTRASLGHIPLWLPFIAVGIIAVVGATLSMFAEPDPLPAESSVPTARRNSLRDGKGASRAQKRSVPPPARQRGDIGRPVPMLRSSEPPSSPEPEPDVPPISAPTLARSPAPAATEPLDSDAGALLAEIDAIDAAIHGGRAPVPARPSPTQTAGGSASAPPPTALPAAGSAPAGVGPVGAAPAPAESPRTRDRCVGCGSTILHSGSPARCQVCGEPLCTDCRDRSLAEGKPNLCPLCGLLDSVHSKASPTGAPARSPH